MKLNVDGRPVRVARLGPDGGRPLVFVHGAGLRAEAWGALPRLCAADGFACLVADLPGHGASAGPALTSIAAMADWTTRLLRALPCGRPILVGHSMGALVALHAAATGAGCAGLVLVGAGLTMPVNPRLLDTARTAPAEAAGLIARWAIRDGRPAGRDPMPTPTMRMAARRLLASTAPGVLSSDLSACNLYDQSADMAARVAVPALLVIGGADRMTPPAAGMALAELLPHARTVVIPGCGHLAMAEAPARLRAAIRSFALEHCA